MVVARVSRMALLFGCMLVASLWAGVYVMTQNLREETDRMIHVALENERQAALQRQAAIDVRTASGLQELSATISRFQATAAERESKLIVNVTLALRMLKAAADNATALTQREVDNLKQMLGQLRLGQLPPNDHARARDVSPAAATPPHDTAVLQMQELAYAVEVVEAAVRELLRERTGTASDEPARSSAANFETRWDRHCDSLLCHGRGLGVKIPNVTKGCECSCTGGYTGAACQRFPPTATAGSPAVLRVPSVVIPLDREELPSRDALPQEVREKADSCRQAAVQYFLERKGTEEFRSDKGVDFFWKLALDYLPPYCGSTEERIMIVDVGAHVGERLHMWEELLIQPRSRHRCLNPSRDAAQDSVVLLVEPNPLNLAVLRHDLAMRTNPPDARGSVVLAAVAAAHYDGEALLRVDLAANRNKKRSGNERGYLDFAATARRGRKGAQDGGVMASASTHRLVRTPVHTLSTLIRSVVSTGMASAVYRPITNISVLKIDAEGMDALVLYGAHEILPLTGAIVFECHKLWHERGAVWDGGERESFGDVAGSNATVRWSSLAETVAFLAKHEFQTYKVGVFYWIPLTPPLYWDDVYEENMEWSNCVAIRPGHPLRNVFSTPPACD